MTAGGKLTAFIFGQDTPRGADYCTKRVSLNEVELRARLDLLPMMTSPTQPLDADLGCS
jgi:hypothetical protein